LYYPSLYAIVKEPPRGAGKMFMTEYDGWPALRRGRFAPLLRAPFGASASNGGRAWSRTRDLVLIRDAL
jgi:hypothetical protein